MNLTGRFCYDTFKKIAEKDDTYSLFIDDNYLEKYHFCNHMVSKIKFTEFFCFLGFKDLDYWPSNIYDKDDIKNIYFPNYKNRNYVVIEYKKDIFIFRTILDKETLDKISMDLSL